MTIPDSSSAKDRRFQLYCLRERHAFLNPFTGYVLNEPIKSDEPGEIYYERADLEFWFRQRRQKSVPTCWPLSPLSQRKVSVPTSFQIDLDRRTAIRREMLEVWKGKDPKQSKQESLIKSGPNASKCISGMQNEFPWLASEFFM